MRVRAALPFASQLLTFPSTTTDDVRATFIVKQTFDLHAGGETTLAGEQLPVAATPMETPFGALAGDMFRRKRGVDVVVLGTMRAAHPLTSTVLTLRVGESFVHRLRVTGARRWVRRGTELVPSSPESFTEMPIAYERAYGGTVEWNLEEGACSANPIGVGYYLSEKHAEGNPLPFIEDDTSTIGSWDERPDPAGWAPYPRTWALRRDTVLDVDAEGRPARLHATIYNSAHPSLVLGEVTPWQPVVIECMRPEPIRFWVPKATVSIRARSGSSEVDARSVIDGIYVWVDQAKVVITQRAHFTYPYRPGERRVMTAEMAA